MKIGMISDTHDAFERTRVAVELLAKRGAELLVHCGDLFRSEIVEFFSSLPFCFVFGNHDADRVGELQRSSFSTRATCLGSGGGLEMSSKKITVAHRHLTMDLTPLLDAKSDYLLIGHFHQAKVWTHGTTSESTPARYFV